MPDPLTSPEPTDSGALAELARDDTSRKRFLRMMGGGAAATALAGFLAACGGAKKPSTAASTATTGAAAAAGSSSTRGDLAIVNYALTLEYVEADFYDQVIASGLIKDAKVRSLAQRFRASEHQHVDALAAVAKNLGSPVAKPKTDFSSVFDGGLTKILQTAATVENLGAAAYLGQAARIKDKAILAAALSIHSVEARHAAALNQLVGRGFKGANKLEGSLPDGAFAQPMSMDQVLPQVKPFLA